jgi:radical SAM-linked protein
MRVRITFTKQNALRYIGHLDLHQLWERAMRRAELPLAYSQGFHPQPKISLAAALPLGFSSRGEVLDVRFKEDISVENITKQLNENLPLDIKILNVEEVDEKLPALQTQVLSATYDVKLTEAVDSVELKRRVESVMMAESIIRERRGKSYDLRPLIEMISLVTEANGTAWLKMTLAAREGATGRPEEVLLTLQIEPDTALVERTRLIFKE